MSSEVHVRPAPDIENDDFSLWLALAAGEAAWNDASDEVLPIHRLVAVLVLACYASSIAICWVGVLMRGDATGFALLAPWLATTSIGFLAIRPIRLIFGGRPNVSMWRSASWRVLLVIGAAVGLLPNTPLHGWLSIWPFAIALGGEAALVAWATGIEVHPTRWWISFVRSPLHLGVVGGVIAGMLNFGWASTLIVVIPTYLVVHAAIGVGAVTAAVLEKIRVDMLEREQAAVRSAAAAEHRRSAHWLHDDVSSALKLVQMRLERDGLDGTEIAGELANLDHELRLRQLDELFQSGTVRIAEVLQPFVRNAQSQGMYITRVPSFDEASSQVSDDVGRLIARAAAVLMNNAIVAGATQLGFELTSDGQHVHLAIEDDAGGFRFDDVPAGRGLWSLGQELGTGKLEMTATATGSIVSVDIPLSERFS